METQAEPENILELSEVTIGYGAGSVLRSVNIYVRRGEIVAIVGPNGVGKSTLMHAIVGLLPAAEGSIKFNSQIISGLTTQRIIKLGITLVPEGKLLFSVMTVLDNLRLGAYHLPRKERKDVIRKELNSVFTLFPILKDRRKQLAETLSGGNNRCLRWAGVLWGNPNCSCSMNPCLVYLLC